jgi:hypothetical protein
MVLEAMLTAVLLAQAAQGPSEPPATTAPAAPGEAAPAPAAPCPACPPCPSCPACAEAAPSPVAVLPEPEPPHAAYEAAKPLWTPPPARRGFQAALALQWSGAAGDAAQGLEHRDVLPATMSLEAQLGWKLTDRFFAGVYVAGGRAMPERDAMNLCEDEDLDCSGPSGRAGVMVKLDLHPSQAGNVWVGLGAGVERHEVDVAARVPASTDPGAPTVVARQRFDLRGVEPLRVMAGIDFRSTRVFGIGVYAALSFGRYDEVTAGPLDLSTVRPTEEDLTDAGKETHTWFTLGVRGLLFP